MMNDEIKYFENDHLNLGLYCENLSEALSAEFKDTSTFDLIWSFLEICDQFSEINRVDGEKALIHPATIFLVYADWCSHIAENFLSIKFDNDEKSGDWWVTKEAPKTYRLIKILSDVCLGYFSQASEEHRKCHGYTPGDVAIEAINSGEGFDQARVRIHRRYNPLKPI